MRKTTAFMCAALACTVWPSAANLSLVPVPADYKLIMHVDDKYPLVQTGYSAEPMPDIVTFYKQQYGEPDLNRRYASNLTLFYSIQGKTVRISLLQHDFKTDIAIMITQ
ncbi:MULTISPECIES: hypothetical protein [unclassified Pseudoalteromonas]|uniref:hypothetical protein n=1 Tax=unclassified Pseudoalteromonas TaxID=194690 RepID=UPI001179FE46|nr:MULTISPECIES: hypothetical protein [unclassified Pseudoalteromonas]MDP2636500.1 hypothetical protein [Pseudoalteromonas sp. 1_MG-2023]